MVIISGSGGWPMCCFCAYLWLVHNANSSERCALLRCQNPWYSSEAQIVTCTDPVEMLWRGCSVFTLCPDHGMLWFISHCWFHTVAMVNVGMFLKKNLMFYFLLLKLCHFLKFKLILLQITAIWDSLCGSHTMWFSFVPWCTISIQFSRWIM